MPYPVAIVGGGWLGAALAERLPKPVIVTSRSGRWPQETVPEGIEVRRLDVIHDSPRAMGASLAGARACVVCYAPGRSQDRRELYVDGGRRLADAASTLELERLVYASSTSALPDVDGWVDESCSDWPDHERGRIQRLGEQAFITRCSAAGIPWVVLRLAGLYGPGRELDRIYRHRTPDPLPGDGMTATNLIHRDDALTAFEAALSLERSRSGIVHVCDDDHTPRREMVRRLGKARGVVAVQWQHEPGQHEPGQHEPGQHEPASGAQGRGKRVCNERMKTWLGVSLRHPRHAPEE